METIKNSQYHVIKMSRSGGASRWQKSKTWGSSSSPQMHQKYIYMWNNSYRTLAEELRPPKRQETPHVPG